MVNPRLDRLGLLLQIGKGTHKRAHAVDSSSPSRSPRGTHSGTHSPRSQTPSDYPTLKLPTATASPHGLHTSTPHALPHAPRAHARLEQASAVLAPSSSVAMAKPERTAVHKLGVRVLPAQEPSEKRQNVHNAYLERGIDVPDGYNPYAPQQPAAAGPPSPRGFHDVDLGGRAAAPAAASLPTADDHHRMGIVAKEVKTKISKGLHSLLHSLDRAGKKGPAKDEVDGSASAAEPASLRSTPRTSPRASPEAAIEVEIESEVMTRKPSGRGIPTEIPEEVRLAAMAARSNRKSLASLASLAEATVAVVETDSRASSPGSADTKQPQQQPPQPQQPKRNKGIAPRPPSATPEAKPEILPEVVSEASLEVAPEASTAVVATGTLVNGDESLLSMQSDSDSECVVTVHSVHPVLQDEEKTRKAASLGDLSRIEEKLSAVAVLERAVSLDLDAPAGHGKKRKAPAQPDDDDDMVSLDAADDMMIMARKEPRLDSVGLGHGLGHGIGLGLVHGLSTFERSRLKKSSDWGTLEEALKDDGVRVTTSSSTAPTVAEVIPKSEARNSFFVGMMTRGHDESDEQPFSFSASSLEPLEPLSIEVRGEESPVPVAAPASSSESPCSAPTSAERDRVLWSVPSVDGACASHVSVSSTSVPTIAEAVSSVSVNPHPAPAMEAVSSVSVGSEAVTSVSVGLRAAPATPPPVEARGSVSVSSSPTAAPADPSFSGPSSLSSLTIVSSTPMRPADAGQGIATAVQSPIVTSSDLNRASGFAGFVSTTQLNSLEDVAFLSAVDSSTLMHDAMDGLEDDDDDDDVATPSPPDLPSSPMPVGSPMSSLTYVTEIQVTTPEPVTPVSKVLNGFSSPPDSPEAGSPRTPRAVTSDDATAATAAPSPAARLNGDAREAATSASTPSTIASTSAATTPKAGRNVSVTNIQGSRIPVRAASHSPEDRGGRGNAQAGPGPRPPIPARRSTDPSLSPRKTNAANGSVQVVGAHPNDDAP